MNSLQYTLFNLAWASSLTAKALSFWLKRNLLKESQETLLQYYLKRNAGTIYGKRNGFKRINSYQEYRDRVPLTNYDSYLQEIGDIAAGVKNVLTHDPVLLFERSSGSTAASKRIPYTAALKQEFQRGLSPWIGDLFAGNPQLLGGPAYWSISPIVSERYVTPGGIPIGFDDDSAYLGGVAHRVVSQLFAVPRAVQTIPDVEDFRYVTLLFLLGSAELRLMSVWSPTFLSLLMERLPLWWESLVRDLSQGTLSLPQGHASGISIPVLRNKKRAMQLLTLLPQQLEQIWPNLSLISCWTDGASARYVTKLRQLFSEIPIQGKGLLATEAFVTFPLLGVEGGVLSALSHFYEFIPQSGDKNRCYLAHEIEIGEQYAVVVTTGGGFYRYQLQDIVEVVGRWHSIPTLRFIGKEDCVSDLFGEKLSDAFVESSLSELFAAIGVMPRFSLVTPEQEGDNAWYTLFLELGGEQWISSERIAEQLEILLQRNFNYRYCRELRQLGKVRVSSVKNGLERYIERQTIGSTPLGAIKSPALDRAMNWRAVFL